MGGFSLTFRISLAITVLIVFLMAAVGISMYVSQYNAFIQTAKGNGWAMVKAVKAVAAGQIQKGNYQFFVDMIKNTRDDMLIRQAALVDVSGRVAVQIDSVNNNPRVDRVFVQDAIEANSDKMAELKYGKDKLPALSFASPVIDRDGNTIGAVYIVMDIGYIYDYFRKAIYNLVVFFALGSVIGLLITRLIVLRAVGKPVKGLITATEKISVGDFSCKLQVDSKDELGRLTEAFNVMNDYLGMLFGLIKSNIKEMEHISEMIIQQSHESTTGQNGIDSDKSYVPMKSINNNAKLLSRLINKLSSLATQFKVDTTFVPACKAELRQKGDKC
jgi:methyl-accepting chemotaxis protein